MSRVDTPTLSESGVDLDAVLDVGTQIQETVDQFLPYVDDEAAAREFLELAVNPRVEIYGGPSAYPLYEYKKADEDGTPAADGEITEPIETETIVELQSEYGIDRSIVNPTLNRGISEVNNDRFAVAIATGYNDWLVDELDGHDSLVGTLLIAPQHPDRAAAEIDRMASADAIVGIQLPITGMVPPAGHRMYDPIYEAAESHGLPITLSPTVGLKSFHQQFYSAEFFAEDYLSHPPFLIMDHVSSLLFEGVPERYPGIDFVLLAAGIDWAPYLITRMNDHYLELGYEIPVLDKLPREYFRDSFYWGTAPIGDAASRPDPEYLSRMLRMVGVENVVYSSDLPHPLTESPAALVDALSESLSEDDVAKVMAENASGVFGL